MEPSGEKALRSELPGTAGTVVSPANVVDEALRSPLCPVDRLSRRRRNQLCIAIIALGGVNFLVYTLVYAALGGDARNGHIEIAPAGADGSPARAVYYLSGHYLHSLDGKQSEVSRGLWIYSYVHSITVPITSGAVIISMLVLARPHILATMRDGFVSGQAFVTSFATVVILLSSFIVILFTWQFIAQLANVSGRLTSGS